MAITAVGVYVSGSIVTSLADSLLHVLTAKNEIVQENPSWSREKPTLCSQITNNALMATALPRISMEEVTALLYEDST